MAKVKKVREGEEFRFVNGTTADTVSQMKTQLKKLTPEQFSEHVNSQKNDVYNWLRDCVDPTLAEKVRGIHDKDRLVQALNGK